MCLDTGSCSERCFGTRHITAMIFGIVQLMFITLAFAVQSALAYIGMQYARKGDIKVRTRAELYVLHFAYAYSETSHKVQVTLLVIIV